MSRWFDGDYDPETYPRMGMLLKKKRESAEDAGFFELIQFLFNFNYLDVDGETIDRMFWSRVALRTPSPIVVNTHDEDEGVKLTYTERVEIARMMYAYYKVKWEKQKAVVAIEYDPIHNYLDEWSDTSAGALSKTGSSSASRIETPNVTVTKDNLRTDNLLETDGYGSTTTNTDSLLRTTTFGKTQTTTHDTTDTHRYDVDETEGYDNFKEESNFNSYSELEFTDREKETQFGKTETTTYPDGGLKEIKDYGKGTRREDHLTETDSGDNGTKEEQIYAFNSVSFQPTNKEIHTNWGGNQKDNTGFQTHTDSGQDVTTKTGATLVELGGDNTEIERGKEKTSKGGKDWLTKSGEIQRSKDGSETIEKDGTIGVADGGTEQQNDSVSKTELKGGTDTVSNTGTQTNHATESTTGTNQRTDTGSETVTGTDTRDRSGVHSGNIGNLTSQKQIGEEIALWKWNFIEEIMADATDFLTLQVYC